MSKRLVQDLKNLSIDKDWNFTVNPDESNLSRFTATIPGPVGSPYEGGTFVTTFEVPPEYPLKPPRVGFQTRVYHPNISSANGAICLDILKTAWTPVYTIKAVLISLQQLLDSPNASDPQDAEVAGVYTRDYKQFERTAREWTQKYAGAQALPKIDEETLSKFIAMGFDRAKVEETMRGLGMLKVDSPSDETRLLEALL